MINVIINNFISVRIITRCACLLALLAIAACQPPQTHYPTATTAEIAKERAAHERLVSESQVKNKIEKEQSMMRIKHRVQKVWHKILKNGAPLCRKMPVKRSSGENCIYNLAIENKKDLNAWADGKKVVITTAMANFLRNDSELALVLSHEYAHNLMHHPQNTRSSATVGQLAGVLADTFAGAYGVKTGGLFQNLGGYAGVIKHSVGYEQEADYVGMYIASRAGYNSSKAPELWRKMSVKHPKSIYNRTTHPTNPERYLALKKAIAEIESKKKRKLPLIPEVKKTKS